MFASDYRRCDSKLSLVKTSVLKATEAHIEASNHRNGTKSDWTLGTGYHIVLVSSDKVRH